MKAIVEQYAKGEFVIDRPKVTISETNFKLNIEAGTIYEGSFMVSSDNKFPIKGMVYDSRYLLRFETHTFISRKFEVKYSFDATCLEVGQNYRGHINVVTDGGEFRIPYNIDIVMPCVRSGEEKIDDLFKFASLAERNWKEAAKIFVQDDFKRTFINKETLIKQIYDSLLDSQSVDQAMEEFLVLVHKKRTVTLSVDKAKLDMEMPEALSKVVINVTKNTWGFTSSDIRSTAEFIIPVKKSISTADFIGNVCALEVYISPEHIPEGENGGTIIIENIYQKLEVDIHLSRPARERENVLMKSKNHQLQKNKIKLTRAYLDFRMDRITLDEYIRTTKEAFYNLNELEPEEDMHRLGIMHMNILEGDLLKVEQEFLRIEADVDSNLMSNEQKCYYNYLKAMVLKDEATVNRTANMLRRNYRTQEPKMFYFWLLLFVDKVYAEDKSALYRELEEMYNEGENSPIIYFELCEILNNNPMLFKKLSDFEITTIKWGMRNHYISDDVLNEFIKLAGKNKDFNKQIFDVLRQIYDKNENELKLERLRNSFGDDGFSSGDSSDTDNNASFEDSILADGITQKQFDKIDIDKIDKIGEIGEIGSKAYEDYIYNTYGIEVGSKKSNNVNNVSGFVNLANMNDDNDANDSADASNTDGSASAGDNQYTITNMDNISDISFTGDGENNEDFATYIANNKPANSNSSVDFKGLSISGSDNSDKNVELTEKYIKKENENLEVLKSICSMLISANMLDNKYHRFYKAAVLKSLKFIGINECYIRSMNHEKYEMIPPSVLMYLNYKNTLNEEELAYLYANVIFNKDAHMKIYHEYAPTMEDFMENMIVKGKVNDDLTVIYDEFLEPESVGSVFAGKLVNIIFRRKLVCYNKGVRAVIVTHEELKHVQRVPLVNGEAYVEILSENASIIFEDKHGNRYAGSIPYHFERIVDEKAYIPICREYSPRDYRVMLFNYESIGEFTFRNAKEVNAARDIINCDEISYDFKQQACLNIIEYYHENLDTDVLVRYLGRLDIEYLTHANARTIITYLIDMNMFDKAFQAVKLYGFNELDVKELYRLADYGVRDSDGFVNEDLMSICLNLYKTGTVNANILSYLIYNFKGGIRELSELFKLARDKVSDVGILAENALAQMMFANGYFEYVYDMFQTYYNGRSRGLVVKAFLRLAAHNYIIKDHQIPNYIFESLYVEIVKGNIDDEVSKMALLLYFSRLERYTEDQKIWIAENVEKFMDAGKILPFYKSFSTFVKLPQDVFLKTYLIYKTENLRQVFVNYSFDTGTRNKVTVKTERLEEILPGYYVKEFVVFHGERLVYSIADDADGNVQVVESEVLKSKAFNKKDKNRFEVINSMLVKQEMREDSDLLEALDIYINTVHLFEENLDIL